MAGNVECEKAEHRMHMCVLYDKAMPEKNPDRFAEMTEPSRYECGARAVKSELRRDTEIRPSQEGLPWD